MKRLPALTCLCAALVAGCAQPLREAPAPAGSPLVFVLVRHAEKAADDPKDPSLSEIGQARAQRLARSLEDAPVTAVYATVYRRTQQTALPTAAAHGRDVLTYDARQSADAFAAEVRAVQRHGTVLIVGHSNTIPALANLIAKKELFRNLLDTEYGVFWVIRMKNGAVTKVEMFPY